MPRIDSVPEILALQHLLESDHAVEPNDFFKSHLSEPVAVGHELSSRRVEDLESLGSIGFGVRCHLFAGKLRPRRGTSAWVADHGSEIANDKDRLMSEVLKLPKLPQDNGVAEV